MPEINHNHVALPLTRREYAEFLESAGEESQGTAYRRGYDAGYKQALADVRSKLEEAKDDD